MSPPAGNSTPSIYETLFIFIFFGKFFKDFMKFTNSLNSIRLIQMDGKFIKTIAFRAIFVDVEHFTLAWTILWIKIYMHFPVLISFSMENSICATLNFLNEKGVSSIELVGC